VFNSELLGTAVGIMQTEGWVVFSGLLTSDSLPVNILPANSMFTSVFQKIPLNFNKEYFKGGKKVCAINCYYKNNPDSSFYIRKLIYIRPCLLGIQCFYAPGKTDRTGHIYAIITGKDTTGTFLKGRLSVSVISRNKSCLLPQDLHAQITLFDLLFSIDADLSGMKCRNRDLWNDVMSKSNIEVFDNSSDRYMGRFELSGKDKEKKKDLFFVFSDGSQEPAAAYFSLFSILKSKD